MQTENNINQMQAKQVNYIDLFCGLGAFHTAFDRNNRNINTPVFLQVTLMKV